MAIKVKAVERNVAFEKGAEKWAYVLQADLYNKLSQAKVIQEASLRSGISKGAINAAWDAIGEVIKAWATEGHAVAVPGLGSMRFGIRSTSVANVNKVGADLITARRVIFTPSVEIKDELKKTSINITCYDRNGEIVKRVTSSDDSEIEDNEDDNNDPNGGGSGSGTGTGSGTNTNRQYSLNISSADTSKGTVDTSVNKSYSEGSRVNIKATPASGYVFDKWSDGNTSATRTVTMNANTTLVASFIASTGSGTGTQGGGTGDDEDDNPAFL